MIGGSYWYILLQTTLQFSFFMAQWEEYHTVSRELFSVFYSSRCKDLTLIDSLIACTTSLRRKMVWSY